MYDFVFLIDFGNTSKTYYSCLSLNCSPMINFKIGSLHKTIAHVHVYYMVYCCCLFVFAVFSAEKVVVSSNPAHGKVYSIQHYKVQRVIILL